MPTTKTLDIPPPKEPKAPPKVSTKQAPPPPEQTSHTLTKPANTDLVPLSFKVTPDFKAEFDIFAAEKRLKKKELLQRMFEHYKSHAA